MSPRDKQIREHLGLESAERVIPTGSMWPTIRPGDAIRFRRSERAPRIGEIWVAEWEHAHVCHRVLWATGSRVWLKGDANLALDAPMPRSRLFGPVAEIRRRGSWRPTNRRRDRLLGLALSGVGTATQASRFVLSRLKRRLLAIHLARP